MARTALSYDYALPNVNALAARWWMLVIRGLAAIGFGVLAIGTPGESLLALVYLFGAYALVDGVFNLMLTARGTHAGRSWGWLLFEGILSIATGLLTFLWPAITTAILLTVIAVWAVFTGVAEIAGAIMLRRQIRGEWLLASSGVLSIVFGVLLISYPASGVLALMWIIGTYAIAFGALLVALGLRLRSFRRRTERSMPPPGGTPTPA